MCSKNFNKRRILACCFRIRTPIGLIFEQWNNGHMDMNPQFPEHEHLNCPRCDSNNTKFCYYNNYNLLQPRHFCKNCKRYWTKGGTLRNIPIGGGTRKISKRGSSNSKRSPTSPTPATSSLLANSKASEVGGADHDGRRMVEKDGSLSNGQFRNSINIQVNEELNLSANSVVLDGRRVSEKDEKISNGQFRNLINIQVDKEVNSDKLSMEEGPPTTESRSNNNCSNKNLDSCLSFQQHHFRLFN